MAVPTLRKICITATTMLGMFLKAEAGLEAELLHDDNSSSTLKAAHTLVPDDYLRNSALDTKLYQQK